MKISSELLTDAPLPKKADIFRAKHLMDLSPVWLSVANLEGIKDTVFYRVFQSKWDNVFAYFSAYEAPHHFSFVVIVDPET